MTTWVLLRGLTRETAHWNGFDQRLATALGPQHRVLTLDLPGNGTQYQARSPACVADMARACRAELHRRSRQPPFVVVAMSLGAMVAVDWACSAPQDMAGCVLINTSLRGLSPFWQRLQPRNYALLAGVMVPGRTPLEREQAVLAVTSNQPAHQGETAAAWAAVACQRPVSRGNAFRQLLAAARYRAPAQPPAVPALLLSSAGDRLVSMQCSQRIAAAWGWPLRIHPDAGHDLPLDAPGWVQQQICDWWAGGAQSDRVARRQ
jgi:pimeloyl-ACP methyl ester carboxylesterase